MLFEMVHIGQSDGQHGLVFSEVAVDQRVGAQQFHVIDAKIDHAGLIWGELKMFGANA